MARVLIIDDDEGFRASLEETMETLGHEAIGVATGEAGLAMLEQGRCDVVLVDFRLPGLSGLDVLRAIAAMPSARSIPVIMLTAYASVDNTIEAMKLGAFDHLAKPVGRQQLERLLALALKNRDAMPTVLAGERRRAFVVRSPAMREAVKLIGRMAAAEATVLISGETGTGKEEVARALHRHGARAAKPFVTVNCAAIPRDLLESELFGHVRGAFTGATANRSGLFQQADGGTLLLDEIGDMSAELQAKLLRVLQEGVVVPIGASQGIEVNVRILAATHRDLRSLVETGGFREDLLYRLNVLRIHVPPLRERAEDVVPLAEHFLALAGDPPKSLSPPARDTLQRYPWPGNVRELRNAIERASVLARGSCIEVSDLGLDPEPSRVHTTGADLPTTLSRIEADLIRRALADAGGNRAEAARRLGIRRQLLYAKMRQHGIVEDSGG